jgi:hypothetical protein
MTTEHGIEVVLADAVNRTDGVRLNEGKDFDPAGGRILLTRFDLVLEACLPC